MDSVRLDIWLDVACLFRTRSEAQKACRAGKVTANGQSVKLKDGRNFFMLLTGQDILDTGLGSGL